MEENQPTDAGPGLPTIATIVYACLLLWAAIELGSRGNSGCDGGTCAIGLLLIPVYLVAYVLLLPATFWLQRPRRSIGGGIGAAVLTLLSLGIATSLSEPGGLAASSAMLLLLCGGATLIGIVLGFLTKLTAKK